MKVQIYYFGNFRSIASKSEQTIELFENASIRELLDLLIDQYPKMAAVLSTDKIKKSHVLLVRGEKPVLDYKTRLIEGDQIYLFIMLAGG